MKSQEKELLISQVFNAPINVVFGAWTNPEKLKHWHAPDGCNIKYKTIEVKEGGKFHFQMRDPTHGAVWVVGEYLEIVPLEKLVFTMQFSNENGDVFESPTDVKSADWPAVIKTTVTFEPIGNQTRATLHETVSEEKAKKSGEYQGWIQMFNKLNEQLPRYSHS
jgi:uncharacterized protein YndB with AHSA1/START domain